jgi:transposase, IS6 family
MTRQHPFKWCHFQADIILLCVRWYVRYPLSYRHLEEMMMERGLHVDHTTMYRQIVHVLAGFLRDRDNARNTEDTTVCTGG